MSKELTPLEALERLRPKTTYEPYYTRSEKRHYCDIIETALKALEIIKEKMVNINTLIHHCLCLADYNKFQAQRKYELTQEEFDLLKEVLK